MGLSLYPLLDPRSLAIRSGKWPALRDKWLKEHPTCCISGLKMDLEVHHVKPVHLFPDLELEWSNLRTASRPYHFLCGHYCNWSDWNKDFDQHAAEWLDRIRSRSHAE